MQGTLLHRMHILQQDHSSLTNDATTAYGTSNATVNANAAYKHAAIRCNLCSYRVVSTLGAGAAAAGLLCAATQHGCPRLGLHMSMVVWLLFHVRMFGLWCRYAHSPALQLQDGITLCSWHMGHMCLLQRARTYP
jgi:hypothetical protein